MRLIGLVLTLFTLLVPAIGIAGMSLPVGEKVRLITVRPPDVSGHADTARVVREDVNTITLAGGPGEVPVTWSKESRWLTGTLVAADDERIEVQIHGGGDRVTLRREDITSMDVNRRRSRARGALIGAAVGAGTGALIGYGSGDDPPGFFTFSAEAKAVMAAVVLAPIGALIGVAVPPGERWAGVPADRFRLGLAPVGGAGMGASLRVAF